MKITTHKTLSCFLLLPEPEFYHSLVLISQTAWEMRQCLLASGGLPM